MDEYTCKDFFRQVFTEAENMFLAIGVAPYIIPYLPRRIKKLDSYEGPTAQGILLGTGSSLGSLGLQGYGYYEAVKHGYPEFLLLPVAANLGILLYEKVIKKIGKRSSGIT
jgi:hypothetical protein